MKVLVLLLAILGATQAGQINIQDEEYFKDVRNQQRLFEGVINSTINKFIDILTPFDPIIIDLKEINIIGHEGEVNNVAVSGFSNAAATHIDLGGFITWGLELEIEAPLFTANVENWKVLGPFFFGEGAISVRVEKTKLKVDATINPITQYVKTLQVIPSIGHAEVSITGLYNDPELSQSLSNLFNYLLNDFINNNTEFHDTISKLLLYLAQNM